MGSFNLRCAISKLPIVSGDKVKLMVVIDKTIDAGSHNLFSQIVPISGVMSGVYYDYGRPDLSSVLEDESNQLVLENLMKCLDNFLKCEFEYDHSKVGIIQLPNVIRFSYDNFDMFIKDLLENHTSIEYNTMGCFDSVGLMLIHEQVYDKLINIEFDDGSYKDINAVEIGQLRDSFKQDPTSNDLNRMMRDATWMSSRLSYVIYQMKFMEEAVILNDDRFMKMFIETHSLINVMERLNINFEKSLYEAQTIEYDKRMEVQNIFLEQAKMLLDKHGG